MALRLNEDKPFGTVHPPMDGAYYEQDGKLFGHDKLQLGKAGADKGAAKSAPSSTSEAKTETEYAPVDLSAWVRGEIKTGFFKVKAAALAQFPDIDTTNAATLKAGLVANGIGAEAS
jgi:hypothetical protein